MPLLLAAIGQESDKGFKLIGEHPGNKKNLSETVSLILPKLAKTTHKRTLTQSIYHFHYKVSGEYAYIVVADPEFPLRISYAFLDDVETQYLRTRTPHVRNLLKDRMAYYNNLKNDKITSLHDKIDGVKTNMIGNIDKLLDRGESLDSLLDRSDELNASAEVFKRGSTKLKVAMVKRNIVIAIVIAIVILVSESSIITIQVAIFFIIWAGCGMPKWQRCAAPAPAPVESPVVQVTPHFHIQ